MDSSDKSIEVTSLLQEVIQIFKQNMHKLLNDTGMSGPQCMLLGLLSKNKKMKITELALPLSLSNSTVSGIIDRLEKQGMVQRERSAEDKRVVYVSISDKFKDMHEVFHGKLEKNIRNTINKGSEEELSKIFEGLIILKKLLS
jgi:DNA-binding MarR family transcriptional regulator